MPDPVPKNLKHKTDVLSWDELPRTECELNFRRPAADRLALSPVRAAAQLAMVSGLASVAGLLVVNQVAPFLRSRSLLEALLVAGVVSALIAAGNLRPLPRLLRRQNNTTISLLGAVSVLLPFLTLRLADQQHLFGCGVFLFLSLAVPGSLFVADQLTGQMIHWLSADPRHDRNTMVVWRNAWRGRFLTGHVDALLHLGVSAPAISKLKKYWRTQAAVGLGAALSVVAGMLAARSCEIDRVGLVIVAIWTSLLLVLALGTLGSTAGAAGQFSRSLGHWFEYHRDQPQPPWVLKSPAGPQLRRAVLAWGAAGAMACAWLLLGLCAASCAERRLADLAGASLGEQGLLTLGALVLTPVDLLLVWFLVSAPTISACQQAIEEAADEQE